MNCIMKFLSDNAAAITGLATVVIALFTILMWWVSHRIHQATQKRDNEISEILINLTAATLVNPIAVEREDIIIQSFEKLRKKVRNIETN